MPRIETEERRRMSDLRHISTLAMAELYAKRYVFGIEEIGTPVAIKLEGFGGVQYVDEMLICPDVGDAFHVHVAEGEQAWRVVARARCKIKRASLEGKLATSDVLDPKPSKDLSDEEHSDTPEK